MDLYFINSYIAININFFFYFSEFDQFLAERASKAKHRPQMQTQEETTDTMFEL